jgi:hypothetical protein
MIRLQRYEPIPDGEITVERVELIQVPENYNEIIYAVHPSTIDGDTSMVVKDSIQQYLQTNSNQKIILIAPPQRAVYLNEGTKVNIIRIDSEDYKWVSQLDIRKVDDKIILVGGNLELCIGALVGNLKILYDNWESTMLIKNPPYLSLDLELNAIYSRHNVNASSLFNYLLDTSSPTIAALSLLSTNQPRTGYGSFAYGEFPIISSDREFRISLNGNLICVLTPNKNSIEYEPGWVKQENKPTIPMRINLVYIKQETDLDDKLKQILDSKIKYAQDELVSKFKITQITEN